jgi:hypothetical protein
VTSRSSSLRSFRQQVFVRELYELKDYNKSLELDIDALKTEIAGLVAKNKKEKKARQAAEAHAVNLQTE